MLYDQKSWYQCTVSLTQKQPGSNTAVCLTADTPPRIHTL